MTQPNPQIDLAQSLDRISIHDLRERIRSLRNANFESLPDEAVASRIRRVMSGYAFQLRPLILSGVYRARLNEPGELFSHAQQLWYPPARCVTSPSRLNRANDVRFYAASTPNAAMLELRPLTGGLVTVVLAETREAPAIELKNTIFLGIERSLAREVKRLKSADLFRTSAVFRKTMGEGNYKKWRLIDDYFGDILTASVTSTNRFLYKPTIALADVLFSWPNLEAIHYPSVESQGHGINFCALPDLADRLFQPVEAWMIKIEEQRYDAVTRQQLRRIEFKRRSLPINDSGVITWLPEGEGIDESEILRFTQHRLKSLNQMPSGWSH